jgi:hypothetical protein
MRAILRSVLLLALATFMASPLLAQKKARRDPSKIPIEELAEYGNASVAEVISRARPNFLILPGLTAGDRLMTGVQASVAVYLGTQMLGDTSALRFYKASELHEVRYYKPTNALSPHTAGDAYVIQMVLKDRAKQ